MLKAFKYRIYPNKEQRTKIEMHFGHTRHIYNWGLAEKKKHYEEHGNNLSKYELQKQIVLSKKGEKPWLKDVCAQSILCSLFNLEKAFTNFFRKRTGFPKFKSKRDTRQSYQCPQQVSIDQENGRLNLPKIKNIKMICCRNFEGKIKTCTISKTPKGHYYISVLVEDGKALPELAKIEEKSTFGIDVGISSFIITSNGYKAENMRFLKRSLQKLKQRQRQLSRCKKGSKKRTIRKFIVARVHDKITKQREFYHHQVANKIVNDNQINTIAFEDLNIQGMIKNRKLAKHIADVSWARFVSIVQYKALWKGKNVIFCSRFAPSSKTCSCGHVNTDLKLLDRVWECTNCHVIHDRDVLAANNIKNFAISGAVG